MVSGIAKSSCGAALLLLSAVVLWTSLGQAETGSALPGVLRRAARLCAVVSRHRQLPFRRPPCLRLASQARMMELIRRRVRSQYSPSDLAREGQMLAHLGLVSDPASYEQDTYSLMGDEVAGYYDIASQCLYVGEGLPFEALEATVAHEAVHALQDQHFDLGRLLRRAPGESDALAAASAAVEGDATAVAFSLDSPVGRSPLSDPALPATVRRALFGAIPEASRGDPLSAHLHRTGAFAYVDGLRLVQIAHGQGGWARVNALLEAPPRSTAQVLHPHHQRETLRLAVTLPPGFAGSARPAVDDTLGELVLRSMLAQELGPDEAARATRGWLGDRALLLDPCPGRDGSCLIMVSAWQQERHEDGQAPATSFAQALGRSLARRPGSRGERALGSGVITHPMGQGLCSTVAREGQLVAFLDAIGCQDSLEMARAVLGQI